MHHFGWPVTFVAFGTCVIDANQVGSAGYAAATQVQQSFAVVGTQSITFTSTPPNPGIVGGTYPVAASGGASGNPVNFSVDPSANGSCSISGATVTFVADGTCVIDANQAGNAGYQSAPQIQQNFAVVGTQSITFTSTPPDPALVGGTYTVAASGGASGNPVTFSVDPAANRSCSVSGATVTFVADGTCVIDANQAGNAAYEAAPQAQQSFDPDSAVQTITFTSTPPDPALVGGTYTVAASGGASGNPVTFSVDPSANGSCSISGATVTFVADGTCVIDANQAGNASYEAAPQAQQSFDPDSVVQTITFTSTPPNPSLVGGSYTLTASGGASGNPVTFSVDPSANGSCTISGATVTLIAVGTCVIDANQAGNAGYQAATQIQQSFAVLGTQSIIFTTTPPNPGVVEGSYTPTARGGSSSNPVIFSVDPAANGSCSISGAIVTFVADGTCVIDANQAGNAGYQAAAQVQQSLTVVGTQSITFTSTPPNPGVVGGTFTVTASGGASGNPVTFSVDPSANGSCTISGATVTFVADGTCVIDANQAGDAGDEAAPQVQQSFAVLGTQSITFTSTPPDPALVGGSYTPTAIGGGSGNPVGFSVDSSSTSTCSISAGVVSFNESGTCKLDANQAGNAAWNAAPQVSQSFAVAASSGSTWPSSASAIQANICSNSSYLQSPYSYDGGATSFTSGQYGLPTFGSSGTDFPSATSGVIVPAGSNTPTAWSSNNTVYYFEPGLHTTNHAGFVPGSNSAFVGGYLSSVSPDPEATLDGGGASGTAPLTTNAGADGTLEYLTVQNYTSSSGNSVLGSGNRATGWTYEDNTIGPNQWNEGTSGQNANGGYAIDGGSNTTIEYNCITQNQEGAFNIYGGPGDILTGDVVTHNEISANGLGKYPDASPNPNSCGCSGGGKAFWTLNMTLTDNYVHDNYNDGIWLDFNNAGANISNNYIASNWGFGIMYEASYNANISDNNLQGNGWASDGSWPTSTYCSTWDSTYDCANGAGPSSQHWGNLSAGGMYISGSGGNPNIAGSNYSNELLIEGNNFQNNWSSMNVYTNDQRFSGGYEYTQCDSPLQGTNSTYNLQTQGFVTDGVTNATTAITSSGGFLQVCNNESTPGPAITPSAGWHVYDSAGKIPANDTIASCASAHSCTLTTPATGSTTGDYIQASPTGGCGMADLAGTAEGSSYWDNCLFGTFHVTVSSNTFAMASNSVTGCTSAAYCGEVDLINYAAGFPSSTFDIYNGDSGTYNCTVGTNTFWGYYACNMMLATSPLDNVFSDNTYTWTGSAAAGSWQFRVGPNNGHTISHAVWTGSASGDLDQDVGSNGL